MKRIVSFLLITFLMLSLCSCGGNNSEAIEQSQTSLSDQPVVNESETTVESSQGSISFEEYQAFASQLNEDIYSASVILSNCGNYIGNYWKTLENIGGTFKAEKVLENVDEWLQEKSDESLETVNAAYSDISARYKELLRLEISDPLAQKITEDISEMYDEYCDLYSTVTAPGGSRNTFINNYNDSVSVIPTQYEKISALLK